MIEYHGDIDELRALVRGIPVAEDALKRATVSAVNKSIKQGETFIVRYVSREYVVKQKDVRRELTVRKANFKTMHASVSAENSPGIPLFRFSPIPRKAPSTRRLKSGEYRPEKGVKVMIHRGERKTVKGAFIARMRSGHIGVFKRRKNATGKLPIDELFGPSPVRIMDSPEFLEKLDNFTEEAMDKNMAHEATYFLNKPGVLGNV